MTIITLTPLSLRTYLPGYLTGVCVPSSSLTACDPGRCSCCGDWCCPPRYRDMWLDMACVSHIQCRTWGTGVLSVKYLKYHVSCVPNSN